MADEREVERHTTTVVDTGRRSGGGGIAIAIVLLLLLVLLFVFRNEIFGAASDAPEKVDVDVSLSNNG